MHWPSPWPCVLYSASATRYFLLLVVESVEEFLARMDPEIVKTATEIAKATGTAAGLSIPFTGIVKRMLGPAADELAEMWRDQVRLYRYQRQLKCVQKAERMAEDAGFTPQAVPPKILFPLLEGASFEDDENLHDMWAALLANAASPENAEKIRPNFIAVLKQMAPDEAAILNWFYDNPLPDDQTLHSGAVIAEAYSALTKQLDVLPTVLGSCLDTLGANQLIEKHEGRGWRITLRGSAFVHICRPPKPKESD